MFCWWFFRWGSNLDTNLTWHRRLSQCFVPCCNCKQCCVDTLKPANFSSDVMSFPFPVSYLLILTWDACMCACVCRIDNRTVGFVSGATVGCNDGICIVFCDGECAAICFHVAHACITMRVEVEIFRIRERLVLVQCYPRK